jgi:hypothetical protein
MNIQGENEAVNSVPVRTRSRSASPEERVGRRRRTAVRRRHRNGTGGVPAAGFKPQYFVGAAVVTDWGTAENNV